MLDGTVDIDNYRYGQRGLRRSYADGEESEEHTFKRPREQEPVEYDKIQIHRIKHQLKRMSMAMRFLRVMKPYTPQANIIRLGTRYISIVSSIGIDYLSRAIVTPPIIHASNNTLTASKGSR